MKLRKNNFFGLGDLIIFWDIRVSALHLALGEKYVFYKHALKQFKLQSLESRRDKLCPEICQKVRESSKAQIVVQIFEGEYDQIEAINTAKF